MNNIQRLRHSLGLTTHYGQKKAEQKEGRAENLPAIFTSPLPLPWTFRQRGQAEAGLSRL